MKKFLLSLIAAALMTVGASADVVTVFDAAASEWSAEGVNLTTGTTTVGDVTWYGRSSAAIATGSKTFSDEATWTARMKFGGKSTFDASKDLAGVFEYTAPSAGTVKVYAVTGSTGQDRNVIIAQEKGGTALSTTNTNPDCVAEATVAAGTVYVYADSNIGVYAITFEASAQPEPTPSLNFNCNPAAGSTVESLKRVVLTFPDYTVADVNSWMLADCITNAAGESLGAGSLSYADDQNAITWEYGNKAITEAGTYTITIPAGAISLGDGETMTPTTEAITFTLTVGAAQAPTLQNTYPQANTKINALPDYVTFMFDQEVQQPYACAIQNGYNDPITIESVDYSVIDGNTVKINISEKTKEALGTLGADGVTVYVQLTETQQYDTHFTVAPEFAVDKEKSTFTATGAKLYFNDNVDLVDPEKVTCYVSSVKTKNIATQATLSLNDDEFDAINVAFADELPAGDYTLDIPEGMIKSTSEEPLASVKVEFSVEGETPVTPDKTVVFTYESSSADYPNYEDADWGLVNGAQITVEYYGTDSLVIKNWMNQEGYDLHAKYADGYITSVDNAYGQYAGWAYCAPKPGSDYAWYAYVNLYNASWITNNQIYLSISFDYSTWYNYNLKAPETAINGVKANTTADNAVMYNLAGQRVKNAKGIVIINGKKAVVK